MNPSSPPSRGKPPHTLPSKGGRGVRGAPCKWSLGFALGRAFLPPAYRRRSPAPAAAEAGEDRRRPRGPAPPRGPPCRGALRSSNRRTSRSTLVVGTSAWSFVGSLYASAMTAFQLQTMALALLKDDVSRPDPPRQRHFNARGKVREFSQPDGSAQTPSNGYVPFRAVRHEPSRPG